MKVQLVSRFLEKTDTHGAKDVQVLAVGAEALARYPDMALNQNALRIPGFSRSGHRACGWYECKIAEVAIWPTLTGGGVVYVVEWINGDTNHRNRWADEVKAVSHPIQCHEIFADCMADTKDGGGFTKLLENFAQTENYPCEIIYPDTCHWEQWKFY